MPGICGELLFVRAFCSSSKIFSFFFFSFLYVALSRWFYLSCYALLLFIFNIFFSRFHFYCPGCGNVTNCDEYTHEYIVPHARFLFIYFFFVWWKRKNERQTAAPFNFTMKLISCERNCLLFFSFAFLFVCGPRSVFITRCNWSAKWWIQEYRMLAMFSSDDSMVSFLFFCFWMQQVSILWMKQYIQWILSIGCPILLNQQRFQ